MRKLLLIHTLCVVFVSAGYSQIADINIIPRPRFVKQMKGDFILNRRTKFIVANDAQRKFAEYFNYELKKRLGFKIKISKKSNTKVNTISFFSFFVDDPPPAEFYRLLISEKSIVISAGEGGEFNALQTLLQLLPLDFKKVVRVTAVDIIDQPRFKYRGMHLDVARHFMPVEFVKKYIDLMSQYKFNYFHWHLTEDQGWRIEIKKYPRLTEIGSKRPETVKERNLQPYIGDGIPHGGFYTQEEIKDVVAYAKARHITVIPEIELPGHASAALAAYPQFGCKTDLTYKVQTTWGIFKEVYCPTEETFKFLEDVLTETIRLFPDSPYVHIGGDEVLKDHWKESAFVRDLKRRENLRDEHEVQSYFIRRIERFINSKGKKMIGWDEILEGGLAPNATLMSWRGMKGGIEAAKSKHDVIMTPTDFAYFDYGQGDPEYEPLNIGGYVPLEKVYGFEPVPPELTGEEAKYIIGGQANIWTEYMKTPAQVEYMAFPRMLALSEVLWSKKEDRDFADFQRRLNSHLPRLDKQHVNYRIPEPDGLRNIVTGSEKVSVQLKPAPGTVVIYTTDGSTPDVKTSEQYYEPIEITLKNGEVKILKSIVISAAGRKSVVYAATIVRGEMREPAKTDASKPGVTFEFFIPRGDLSGEGEKRIGETRSILLNQFAKDFDLKQDFAVTFDGYFRAPQDGVYEFQVDSTWDATLLLGSEMIINDAGTAATTKRSVIVPLKAGLHKISLRYNHRGGDHNFRFRWGIKGQGLRQAFGGEFMH